MYLHLSDDEQFNFQINRLIMYGDSCMNLDEVEAISSLIRDMDSWTEEWRKLAEKAARENRPGHAACYYRMAEFYLPDCSERKQEYYCKFRHYFDLAHCEEKIERISIPYENTYLPVIYLKAAHEKGVIVVHGGYDSFMEEFYPLLRKYPDMGYTIVLFEGPGQGQVRKNGLPFTYRWEKPVKAVLDYLHLDRVTLLGISWGGYLALRAAAFDRRIKDVICYDIFYQGLDIMLTRLTPLGGLLLRSLLILKQRNLLNAILHRKMAADLDIRWKITHGMYITGKETPYDFLKAIEKHRLSDCIDGVAQNVLLLAGEKDQYVPLKRLKQIEQGLIHAQSVTSRIFTEEEGGGQHCQVGRPALAMEEIEQFLRR